ncbi:Cfr10I/Bse634I family restriction endonuclease [Spirulina sp. CS-785/01]|uniref:Cfr10I/Bse634I family restriction endonuclease n=1 Tax=Spirulina sp. CS-785/01 TaxID=3021716 RepID=UPI00232DB2FE|nr:Cfr10I/Bse634I family restriction endonuclease [Spirulina sp. CS-785/01]MDB9313931.1 Cfr10I/Bse634I family restriction endonuclease [Spirulina sp. CS-785/01]
MSVRASWFTKKKKIRINSVAIYNSLYQYTEKKINQNIQVDEIVDWIKNKTIKEFEKQYKKSPEVGALNNAIGRWNEFIATTLFTQIALEFNQDSSTKVAIFSLPNSKITGLDSAKSYSQFINLLDLNQSQNSGIKKLEQIQNNIFFPSPDYVIVTSKRNIKDQFDEILQRQALRPDILDFYTFLEGSLMSSEIRAVLSLKTSNRPDRRYQPLFEAAIVKAIAYLLAQNWKYYMVASDLTEGDYTVFNHAISPHGLATQQDIKLVDQTYLYTCKEDLKQLILDTLT